jgi:hypothetical protein
MNKTQFLRDIKVEVSGLSGSGIEISGLRMSFDIVKSINSKTNSSNNCELVITNLSDTTLNEIKKDYKLKIYAGYKQQTALIFVGDITNVEVELSNANKNVIINAIEELNTVDNKKSSISFNKNAKTSNIISVISSKFGIPVKKLSSGVIKSHKSGFSFIGSLRDVLTKICNNSQLEWSMDNGTIQIIENNGTNNEQYLINKNTGMLSIPKTLDNKNRNNGWEIQTLLNPNYKIHGIVKVQSEKMDIENCRIVSIKHTGDTHGNKWKSILEVETV